MDVVMVVTWNILHAVFVYIYKISMMRVRVCKCHGSFLNVILIISNSDIKNWSGFMATSIFQGTSTCRFSQSFCSPPSPLSPPDADAMPASIFRASQFVQLLIFGEKFCRQKAAGEEKKNGS